MSLSASAPASASAAPAELRPDWTALEQSSCVLGESPFWHPHELQLYWVDIPGRQLLRANVFMGSVQRWDMPQEPGCIAPARSGGLVVALRDGIYRAREWGGALQLLVRAPYDTTRQRFNDGKCDPQGRLWVGAMDETRRHSDASLYCLDPAGTQGPHSLREMMGGCGTSNGLAFLADQPAGAAATPAPGADAACTDTLWWADTRAHRISAWHWQAQTNQLGPPRAVVQFADKPAGWSADEAQTPGGAAAYGGRPDGAALDAEGCLWVAMYEGQCLLRLAPDGHVLARIHAPVRCPTMPCFGGDDLRTLYLTTSRSGRSDAERAAQPQAGCVFQARVEVPGRPVDFFAD